MYIKEMELEDLYRMKHLVKRGFVDVEGLSLYKVFCEEEIGRFHEMKSRFSKLEKLPRFPELHVPQGFFTIQNQIYGTIQPYLNDCIPLGVFLGNCKDNDLYLTYLKQASYCLKKFHESGLVLGDMSFSNILVDSKGQLHFVDLEDCAIGKIPALKCSKFLKNYFDSHSVVLEEGMLTKETDKMSFLLEMLHCYFKTTTITREDFDWFYAMVQTNPKLGEALERVRYYFTSTNPEFPYLCDVLQNEDFVKTEKAEELGEIRQYALRKAK